MTQTKSRACDVAIIDAVKALNPSGLLAAAILDQKAEKFASQAVVAELNRGERWALAEYKHMDFVLLEDWATDGAHSISAAYQAKCAFLSDYKTSDRRLKPTGNFRAGGTPSKNRAWWRGGCLGWDLASTTYRRKWPPGAARGGIFFLFEVEDPRQQAKYAIKAGKSPVPASQALEVVGHLAGRHAVATAESQWSCRTGGTRVRLHAAVFEVGQGGGA